MSGVICLVRLTICRCLSQGRLFPSTIQQQVFIIVSLISCFRTAFFIIALDAWDSDSGEVTSNKIAFYSTDEFASVFFFSLTSILALFWAELYYISIQNPLVYTSIIKPLTYAINLGALIAIAVCCLYASSSSGDDVDYVFVQFTITISSVYLIAAIMFGYYARVAASELKQIPVMLSARRERMRLLRMIAMIFIIALLIKACILIYLTGNEISTTSVLVLVAMFFYYFCLELFPLATVLAFYYVEPNADEDPESNNPSELQPLDPSSSNSNQSTPSRIWSSLTQSYGSKPENSNAVDAMIARLSVDV